MKKLLLALAFAATTTSAFAEDCPPQMQGIDACAAYLVAADAPLFTSARQAAADPEVSCLEIRARTPSVLLVYLGHYVPDVDRAGVSVITRFRQMGDWQRAEDGSWAKMLCIPKSWMQSVSTFTICGEEGHYYFNRAETAQFRRQRGRLTADDVARMWRGG